ncbi:recombinase family protein [Heliorestis acidaminivorans]|uniref:recombinase family protein n=1 Tax=Heliorestis acidaminivorans TaxID=553427 RepID=UPI00147858A7|nr:recombinase family protein [Heliorestis acidaminivorans]
MDQNEKRMWIQTLWEPIHEIKQSALESERQGIKVAAYCRVSSKDESITSLKNQIDHYTLFIKNKANWKFVGIYFDAGASAANYKNRRGFQRLLRHCEEGKIDFILTKNVSRFSRNTEELLRIVKELKEWNIGIFFERENIDTSIEYNKFLLSTYSALAQKEIESMSELTRWGFEKQFMKGKPKYSRMLGYDVVKSNEESHLQINEKEAEAVRSIFNMFIKGLSLSEIARQLIQEGVKTSAGKDLWRGSTVKNILTNVTYTGNKLTRVRTKDIFTNKTSQGARDQILIENCHQPIISPEVFELAQKRLEEIKPKEKAVKQKKKKALSGRMKCGHCGYTLSNYPTRGVNYWKCNPSDVGVCHVKTLKEEPLRKMMLKAMEEKYDFQQPGLLQRLAQEIERINQDDHFEFLRLKYITEIELAKQEQILLDHHQDIEKMEKAYFAFEEKAAKLEDDRKYRNATIEWLQKINSVDEWLEKVTIEHLRSWVIEMTIYSTDDYRVYWVDDQQTMIGDCTPYGKAELRPKLVKEQEKMILASASITLPKEAPVDMDTNREVIKIEPSQSALTMQAIQTAKNVELMNPFQALGKPRLRTAAYCRVSTDQLDQKTSLKTQVAYYTYLILKDPTYEFAGIFADEGISGKSLKNRTELLKLLEECKAGNIDLILTKSISRFSRNTLDCLETIRMLRSLQHPVYVYFEKENIHTKDSTSEMMISIFGSIAQEESIGLGESIAWGKRKYAARGIVKTGTICYGYKFDKNKRWVIDEEEAKIVRRIFQDTLAGKSYNLIVKELTEEGIKSPKGKVKWYTSRIKAILENEAYRGNYVYQRTFTADSIEAKIVPNNGEFPQYFIEDHHEAIVSSSDWEKVQSILEERSAKFKNRNRKKYPKENPKNTAFLDAFTCGDCGSLIGHRRYVEKTYEMHSWICNLANKLYVVNRCKAGRFQQKFIELNFMKTLLSIKRDKTFKKAMDELIKKTDLNQEELCLEEELQERIEFFNQQLYEAVNEELNKDGQDSQKVDELTEELVKLHNERKSYSDRKRQAQRYKQELNCLWKQLRKIDDKAIESLEVLRKDQEVPFREDIFTRIVESGKIFSDGKIVYKLKLGLEWSIDFKNEDYKKLISEQKAAERRAKKEAFLEGPEVKALLEFCQEPKPFSALFKFMNGMLFISESHFRETVLNVLLEQGRVKRKFPEKRNRRMMIYYSVEGVGDEGSVNF